MRDESVKMFLTDPNGHTIDDQRQVSEEYRSLIADSGAHAIEIMNPATVSTTSPFNTWKIRTLAVRDQVGFALRRRLHQGRQKNIRESLNGELFGSSRGAPFFRD
jgi:hypothetical protein